MKQRRFVSILALLLTLCLLLGACGEPPVEPGNTAEGTQSQETTGTETPDASAPNVEANTEINGTVTFAVRDNVLEQTKLQLQTFRKIYPNIQVQIQEFSGSDDLFTYLTTQSTAQSMPDVVLGWDNLSSFALQNWLYPLNEFLENDDEIQYVSQELLDGFTYEGKIYAVPAWLQFSCVAVNLDLCDELNLDVPDYDWTIDEFVELAKAATTNSTSGINHLESLDQYLMMEYPQIKGQWGFDSETRTFDLSSGAFEKVESICDELRKIPQLVADEMRDSTVTANGGMDDYAKKFGANADGLSAGKILIANQSTWDDEWLNPSMAGINWDYYPIPAAEEGEGRVIVHADYGMMLSTAKDPEAAFALLKFITYGKDGLLTRMELQNSNAGGLYENNRFTIPSSSHPDVAAAFAASENVPNGVKYMYEHMDTAVKGDYSKVLPDYWKIVNDNIAQAKVRIQNGEDAASVAKETETKVNEDFAASYEVFCQQMQEVQADFEAMRGN